MKKKSQFVGVTIILLQKKSLGQIKILREKNGEKIKQFANSKSYITKRIFC